MSTCESIEHYHCERCASCIEEGREEHITTSRTEAGDSLLVCRPCLRLFDALLSEWADLEGLEGEGE